jgi:peptide-methionine (S)-S-oxide reductase
MMFRSALAAAVIFIAPATAHAETAIFAGGCFWCVESDMDHVKGVSSTISGYAGGTMANPTYENHEGYTEAVKVEFDPNIISYAALTAHFLRTIDVVDGEGQFCDRGHSYIPALVPLSLEQKRDAEAALADAEKALGQKLAVKVIDQPSFYDAEDYHQNYYLGENRVISRFGIVKQADAYKGYRKGCGRDARIKALWGDAAFSFPAGGGTS